MDEVIPIDDTKECPFCGEIIKQVAIKCRFCGELLGSDDCPGVFRDGNQLVMNKRVRLPDRCVKTNEPATRSLTKNFHWYPPWIIALVFVLGPIVYFIIVLAVQKKAYIRLPLSDRPVWRRRLHILIAWLIVLGGIGLFVAGVMNTNTRQEDLVVWLVCGGIVAILVGIAYGISMSNPVKVTKITDTHIWFKGMHPDFLEPLPQWTGNL